MTIYHDDEPDDATLAPLPAKAEEPDYGGILAAHQAQLDAEDRARKQARGGGLSAAELAARVERLRRIITALLPSLTTADQLTRVLGPALDRLLDQLKEDAAWDVDTDAVGDLRWKLGRACDKRLQAVQDAAREAARVADLEAREADLEARVARFCAEVFAPEAHRQPWWSVLVSDGPYLKAKCAELRAEEDRTCLLQALQPALQRVEELEELVRADAARAAAAQAAAEVEAWRTRAVACSWIPDLYFLDAVPDDYKAAWHQIDALPAAKVLRGLHDYTVWKTFPLDAFAVVRDHTNAARHRPADHRPWPWPADVVLGALDAHGRPFPHPFGFLAVLRAVAWQRGFFGTAEAAWKRDERRRKKAKAKNILGGRCRACAAQEIESSEPFEMNHLLYGNGGRKRTVRTDELRRAVIRHDREHGGPPSWVELLCQRCHAHQTEAQRAGVPWGDRIDVRTGEPYSGDDFPEGLACTVPVAARRGPGTRSRRGR